MIGLCLCLQKEFCGEHLNSCRRCNKQMAFRHVPEAFYRVSTLEEVTGYSPCIGPGVKPSGRKWFLGHLKGLK